MIIYNSFFRHMPNTNFNPKNQTAVISHTIYTIIINFFSHHVTRFIFFCSFMTLGVNQDIIYKALDGHHPSTVFGHICCYVILLCPAVFLVETKGQSTACKYHCYLCVHIYSIQIYRAIACEYFCELMRLTCQLLFFKLSIQEYNIIY